jgi:sulfur relay (sulfurtransferase) DsrC/TusE family protein
MNKYQKFVHRKTKKHIEMCNFLDDFYNSYNLNIKPISYRYARRVMIEEIKYKNLYK